MQLILDGKVVNNERGSVKPGVVPNVCYTATLLDAKNPSFEKTILV